MLGILAEPENKNVYQLKYIRLQAVTLKKYMLCSSLSNRGERTLYRYHLTQKFYYSLPATTMDKRQLMNTIKLALQSIKHSLSLAATRHTSQKIPKDILRIWGRKLWINHLEDMASYFRQHVRNCDSIGRSIGMLYSYHVLKVGTNENCFNLVNKKFPSDITDTILTRLLEGIQNLGVFLEVLHWVSHNIRVTIMTFQKK